MRSSHPLALACALIFGFVSAVFAEQLPQFRPALIGIGAKALVNLIDTKKLVEKGQGDAVVMFEREVIAGEPRPDYGIDHASPGSKLLQAELLHALPRAHFIPAVYNREVVPVVFTGTVVFSMQGGRPRLRVFANQDKEELAHENDFIAPQLVLWTTNWDAAVKELPAASHAIGAPGTVELSIRMDAMGKPSELKVLSENPPKQRYGIAAIKEYTGAKFIPAFRNGQPVACTHTFTTYYKAHLEFHFR